MDQAKLDAQLQRFEERMAEGEREPKPIRPNAHVIAQALMVVTGNLDREERKLNTTRYHLAAQHQAQTEVVRDLRQLLDDLQRVANEMTEKRVEMVPKSLLEEVHPPHPQPEICSACKALGRCGQSE